MKNISMKRTAAFVAAFGIALSPTAAATALAQETGEVSLSPDAYNSIDWSKDGQASLQIVKKGLANGETPGDKATGEEMEGTPGSPLAGVTFTIEKVTNVDLHHDEGWKFASAIVQGKAKAEFGSAQNQTTGENGVADFTNLELGLYRVTETQVPEGVVPGKPFYVFVPMTSAASDSGEETMWNYNPTVYPKNTSNASSKVVEDADKNVGDQLTYTITSDVPALADEGTTISKYQVLDDLDEEQLRTSAENIVVSVGDQELVAGTDYSVNVNEASQEVTINFLPAGLDKLTAAKKADPAVQVSTKITADVSEIAGTDGVVKNQARTISNNGGGGGDTTTPSNEVTTKWGKLKINKKNEAGTALAGAKFELYRCSASGVLEGENLTVGSGGNAASEWVTDGNGQITIDGLHVTNLENNDQQIDKNYCLVETKAPEGYAKLVDPIPFKMESDDPNAVNIEYTADVVNVDDDDFLPSTGGMGVGLLIAGGALIVGAGVYAARRNSKSA